MVKINFLNSIYFYRMNYNEKISEIENNIKKINDIHDSIAKKSNEVHQKIENFNKKKNLKLEDSTPYLVFQNKILHNELTYINNHKVIINSSLNLMLFTISESITMMALTVITMYKDIINSENKLVKISKKSEDNIKIVSDISHNVELINDMITNMRTYNEELDQTIKSNNLHCNTLHENLEFICMRIELELRKHKNDFEKTVEYFTNYTNKILEQNEHMVLLKYVS